MWRRQVEGLHHQGTLLSNGLIMLRLFARIFRFVFICFFSLIIGFRTSIPKVCSNIFFKRTGKEDHDLFLQLGSEALVWFNNQRTSFSSSLSLFLSPFFPPSFFHQLCVEHLHVHNKFLPFSWWLIKIDTGDTLKISKRKTSLKWSQRYQQRALMPYHIVSARPNRKTQQDLTLQELGLECGHYYLSKKKGHFSSPPNTSSANKKIPYFELQRNFSSEQCSQLNPFTH